MCNGEGLKFLQLNSVIETAFWVKLSQKKLEEYKLSEDIHEAIAYLDFSNESVIGNIYIDFDSFNEQKMLNKRSIKIGCDIVVMNSKNNFIKANKINLMKKSLNKFINKFEPNNCQNCENMEFFRVLLVTYIDLKKHKCYYWLAYPHILLHIKPTNCFQIENNIIKYKYIRDILTEDEIKSLSIAINNHIDNNKNKFLYFFIYYDGNKYETASIVEPTSEIKKAINFSHKKVYIGFFDHSPYLQTIGWLIKPILLFLMKRFSELLKRKLDFIALRDFFNKNLSETVCFSFNTVDSLFNSSIDKNEEQQVTGLEIKNGKLLHKIDLSTVMSPIKLAESASELNLKLMTWREAPHMNIDYFGQISCLLIGAGTLGCNVARGLLGWGVKNITFIDSGNINHSNPIRQSLYNFNDCTLQNNNKAAVAAEAIKKIAPFVKCVGYKLSVPTPGQFISNESQLKSNVALLESLICQNDVIFLLTDTRESRWLPTSLAFKHQKVVINAAIGFDTFMVMRYSGKDDCLLESNCETQNFIQPTNLSCYFCSDPITPQNTLANRTIDQQCTVTRPGISLMASAYVVEIFGSLAQYSNSLSAPAYNNPTNKNFTSCYQANLKPTIPHIVRFFLNTNELLTLSGRRSSECVACSKKVLDYLNENYIDYIISVIKNPDLLKSNRDDKGFNNVTRGHTSNSDMESWIIF